MFDFLYVPMILFVVIVMPIWVVMHYRSKKTTSQQLGTADNQQLDELLASVDQLTTRIDTLENILDAEHGGWHARQRPSADADD